MPIFVIVMHALCNACWDLVLSRAAMLIKHVLCLVLSSSYGYYMNYTKKADKTLVSIAQQLQLHNTLTKK